MRTMSEEQWQAFLDLFRQYARLRADFGILCGILSKSEISETPAHDWVGQARKLRASASYVADLQEAELLISRVAEMNPPEGLLEVFAKIPPPELPN